jgi:hypothetical protein
MDLYACRPALRAPEEQIVATPTLHEGSVRFPPRRVIGDLSQVERVLHGLEIK